MSEELEFMSAAWVDALAKRVSESEAYKKAAKDWRASIAIARLPEADKGVEAAGAIFDLQAGECKSAKHEAGAGPYEADYVIRGVSANWKALFKKEIFPVPAIMKGDLQLVKGGTMALMTKMAAVEALLNEAAAVPTRWPG